MKALLLKQDWSASIKVCFCQKIQNAILEFTRLRCCCTIFTDFQFQWVLHLFAFRLSFIFHHKSMKETSETRFQPDIWTASAEAKIESSRAAIQCLVKSALGVISTWIACALSRLDCLLLCRWQPELMFTAHQCRLWECVCTGSLLWSRHSAHKDGY